MFNRIIKFLPWLNVGMNVIAFFPFTLHIIITDGGAFGFGYLVLPFTVFMNVGGILAMFQSFENLTDDLMPSSMAFSG